MADAVDSSSGVILSAPAELSEGCETLIAADGRECIQVGPQFADWFWQGKKASWKQEDDALKAFLDKHEERTVIYIRCADYYPVQPPCQKGIPDPRVFSFGSLFWPIMRLDLVADLIETLLECKFPFVLGTMPPGSGVDDLITTIETSGIGMVVRRAPQLALLQHSSVGFCLVSFDLLA